MKERKKAKVVFFILYVIFSIAASVLLWFTMFTDMYVYCDINYANLRFYSLFCAIGINILFLIIFRILYGEDCKIKIKIVNKVLLAGSIALTFLCLITLTDIRPVKMDSPSGSNSYFIKQGCGWQPQYVNVCLKQDIFNSKTIVAFTPDGNKLHSIYVKWQDDDHFYLKIQGENPDYQDGKYIYKFKYYYISGHTSNEITESDYNKFTGKYAEMDYDYYKGLYPSENEASDTKTTSSS